MTPVNLSYRYSGIILMNVILLLWLLCMVLALGYEVEFTSPITYLWIPVLTQLYTGLFITAHDAMHGTLMPGNKKANDFFGWVCAMLFAFNFYNRLYRNHHLHHNHVGSDRDPDVQHAGFFKWYYKFLANYISLPQLLLMGLVFNILWIFLPLENVVMYWMLPVVLSTMQLFYFGTYLPHRNFQNNKYMSTTQEKNHLWAFLSCYFFGYHYEHHDKPFVPWWQLWKLK